MYNIFGGYNRKGKPVLIQIDDHGQVYIYYVESGIKRRFNQEYYNLDDDRFIIRDMIREAGYIIP